MSTFKEILHADLNAARKTKNKLAVTTLGLVISEIQTQEKSGKTAVIFSDREVGLVIAAEVKKRRDTAHTYSEAGQTDRADLEHAEADLLSGYIPSPLTENEIIQIVEEAIASAGENPNFGTVMKLTMASYGCRGDGRSADGRTTGAVVKAVLNG